MNPRQPRWSDDRRWWWGGSQWRPAGVGGSPSATGAGSRTWLWIGGAIGAGIVIAGTVAVVAMAMGPQPVCCGPVPYVSPTGASQRTAHIVIGGNASAGAEYNSRPFAIGSGSYQVRWQATNVRPDVVIACTIQAALFDNDTTLFQQNLVSATIDRDSSG